MKRILHILFVLAACTFTAAAQCTLTNATGCSCLTPGATDCDLLPDMIVAEPPLLILGGGGIVEYSQVGNGVENGRLRISVSTPNIGYGPLECRGSNIYVCGTDTFVGTAPSSCPTTGLPPKQLLKQRVYHKNGSTMSFYDRDAGTMTYHPSHGHQHVDDWGVYTLRSATTDPNPLNWPIIGTGAKLSFCLLDLSNCTSSNGHCVDSLGTILNNTNMPNYGLGGGSYGCSQTLQGISAGYVDIYNQALDGMYITIPPGTCNGQYYIVVQLDPNNNFLESNENNNVLAVPYMLTKQAGTVPSISVTGSTSLCPGQSVILTCSPAPSYLWSTGDTTQSITVNQAGNYSVTTDVYTTCPASSSPVQVSVQNIPVTITPTAADICAGQSSTLNTSVIAPPTSTVQTSFSNNTVINIPDNDPAGIYSPINISGINPATLTATSIFSVMVNITHTYDGDLIVALVAPSGNVINLSNRRGGGGDNFNNTIFSMSAGTPISGGSPPFNGSYVPDGSFASLTGNVNGLWQLRVSDHAGVDIGTLNSWTITFNNEVTTQLAYSWSSQPAGFTSTDPNPVVMPGATTDYTLVVTNTTSGCSGSQSSTVTVHPLPDVTAAPLNSICDNALPLTLTGGSPAGGIWSGPGVTGGQFDATVAGIGTHVLTYDYTDAFGCSGSANTSITVNNCSCPAPKTPSNFQGPTKPCPGQQFHYAVAYNATVTTYDWTPPANATIVSGQGTNMVIIEFDPSFISGPICVTASNACGTSAPRCKNVSRFIPSTPSAIQGNIGGYCETTVNLSTNPVTNAVSYLWTLPAGTTPVSGQGTTAITFTTDPGFLTGSVCVSANNGCMDSKQRCTKIYATPNKPVIAGPSAVCVNQPGVPYSVTPVPGATSYVWGKPSDASVATGQGTESVTIDFGVNSGKVTSQAWNACGKRGTATLPISFNCRQAVGEELLLYPNPASDQVQLLIRSAAGGKGSMDITDIAGRIIATQRIDVNAGENVYTIDVSGFSKGAYMIHLVRDGNVSRLQFVVE